MEYRTAFTYLGDPSEYENFVVIGTLEEAMEEFKKLKSDVNDWDIDCREIG